MTSRNDVAESGRPSGASNCPLCLDHLGGTCASTVRHRWTPRGKVIIVRYADDFVMGFQYETDARRMAKALDERLAKFGLTLNEAKTRLIEFGKLAAELRQKRGAPRPETFAFLGFTHYCASLLSHIFSPRAASEDLEGFGNRVVRAA